MLASLNGQLKSRLIPALKQITLTRTRQVLLGLTIAGAVLRFFSIGRKSIWLDEAYSIAMAQRSLIDLLRMVVRTDTHPPLYYLLLKIWLLFSQSEMWVRSLSALPSILLIPLMYLLVRDLYQDREIGILAAAMMAFSPFHIWYAQEARMYAVLTFFVLASAVFFFRALRAGEKRDWLGFIFMTVLALYSDNGAIWYVMALMVFSLLIIRRFWKRAAGLFLSYVAVGLMYAPWAPVLFLQSRQVTENFWLPPPSFQTVLNTFLDFHSYNFPVIEISLVYLAAIFVFSAIVPGKSMQFRLAALWLFVPLAISLALSLRQSIFLSRNLIVASFGYYLLATDTIWKFKSRKIGLLFLIPLITMNLVSFTRNTWFEEKENWREAAAHVARLADNKPDGLVVFIPGFAELPFNYYFKKSQQTVQTQGYPGDELLLHPIPKQAPDVQELLEGRPYVWLVVRQGESLDQDWLKMKIWLDSNGYELYPGFEQENVTVYGYVRWDLAALQPGRNRTRPSYQIILPLNLKNYTGQYIVKEGETLLEIAIRFNTTVQELTDANKLENPNKLIPGQVLVIP